MKTIWKKNENLAPRSGITYNSVVRRTASGYQWLLMIQTEVVATGKARTNFEAKEAVRKAKAERLGKSVPALAPTGKRGERL